MSGLSFTIAREAVEGCCCWVPQNLVACRNPVSTVNWTSTGGHITGAVTIWFEKVTHVFKKQ